MFPLLAGDFFDLDQVAAGGLPDAILRCRTGGRNSIDGAAAFDFTGLDGIVAGAVVHIYHAGTQPFGHVSAAEYNPPLIIDLDDIPAFDIPLLSLRGVYP